MRISDWSSDVCSSDLIPLEPSPVPEARRQRRRGRTRSHHLAPRHASAPAALRVRLGRLRGGPFRAASRLRILFSPVQGGRPRAGAAGHPRLPDQAGILEKPRSEEHTSELKSLMRISYAVFCLKKTKKSHKI